MRASSGRSDAAVKDSEYLRALPGLVFICIPG